MPQLSVEDLALWKNGSKKIASKDVDKIIEWLDRDQADQAQADTVRPEHRHEDLALFVCDEKNRARYRAIAARGGIQHSEDLIQEAFVKASLALDTMSDDRIRALCPYAWFKQIVVRLAIDYHRRQAAQDEQLTVRPLMRRCPRANYCVKAS